MGGAGGTHGDGVHGFLFSFTHLLYLFIQMGTPVLGVLNLIKSRPIRRVAGPAGHFSFVRFHNPVIR